jgi:hypothetical protein
MVSECKTNHLILTQSHWGQAQGGAELQCLYLIEEAKKII